MNNRTASSQPARRRTPSVPTWIALAAAPAAVAIALTFSSRPEEASSGRHDHGVEAKSSARPATDHALRTSAPLAFTWTHGELLTYEVRSYTTVRVDAEGWENAHTGNTVEITGLCSYRILDVTPERVTLAAQMAHTEVVGDQEDQNHVEQLFDREPVVLVFDPSGRRLETRFRPELAPGDQAVLAGLHEHQVILPEQAAQPNWTTTESGRAAQYACAYRRSRSGGIEKRREALPAEEIAIAQLVRSEISATVGPVWLKSLHARESFAISSGVTRIGTVETSFQMRLADEPVEPEELASLSAEPAAADNFTPLAAVAHLDEDTVFEQQEHDELVARYAGVPLDDMTQDLRVAVETAQSHAETVAAIHALRDWLRVHPEQAFALVDSLVDPSLPAGFTARAIHALELAADQRETQLALADIMQRPGDFSRAVLHQAVIAAGGVGGHLIPELHTALSEAINLGSGTGDFSLSDAALYALGTLAQSNPEIVTQLEGVLLADLDPRNHERATHTALNTLANGRIDNPAIVQQATNLARSHESADVRAAAVRYLSRLPDTTPSQLSGFLQDKAGDVQLEAVNALVQRSEEHPDVRATLENHLASTPPDSVASRLREALAQ